MLIRTLIMQIRRLIIIPGCQGISQSFYVYLLRWKLLKKFFWMWTGSNRRNNGWLAENGCCNRGSISPSESSEKSLTLTLWLSVIVTIAENPTFSRLSATLLKCVIKILKFSVTMGMKHTRSA